MDWFDGQGTKEKKGAIKNAVLVMMADGEVTKSELEFLAKVCVRVGVDPQEIQEILSSLGSVEFTIPESKDERIRQLMDMVFMMMADGKVDPREMDICLKVGTALGFQPAMIGTIVKSLVLAIEKGRGRTEVAQEVSSYLGK